MQHAIKRLLGGAVAAALAVASFPVAAFAQEGSPSSGAGAAQVTNSGNTVTIGNDQLSRTFSTADNKLKTTQIDNKRANTRYTPQAGSEEFIVKMTKNTGETKPPTGIDRTGWTATASSAETAAENSGAEKAIDGDAGTMWHTQYQGSSPTYTNGHWIQFNLGKETTFQAFSYTPRQSGTNGNVKTYKLLYSNEATAPTEDGKWQVAKDGSTDATALVYNGTNPIYVNLDQPVTARFVKFVALSANNGQQFAGCAEFNLYGQKYVAPSASQDYDFTTSDLTLVGQPQVKDTKATINKVEKTGKEVVFTFQPYQFRGVDFTIKQHVVLYNGDHYMRKFLEISVPAAQKDDAVIDYIDLESLKIGANDTKWTIPTNAGGVVQMSAFHANLGQPIYLDGMFLGSEFPETDTQIVDNTGYMRYYTGKSFDRLVKDSQAGTSADGTTVTYNTWQTVVGAARSTDNSVIQSDFYSYIDDIATPTEFRAQYNSWFDNMMFIDDENILESFKEVDKQLVNAGAAPLGSYVVDDGWNNYNQTVPTDATKIRRSGKTVNTDGFWTFNEKFPEGLTPSSALVQKLGSDFGAWVGPRGGYNYYGELANILAASGKGSKAGGSIDVADREYVKNFAEMSMKWQDDYHLNYWKWDGFADKDQFNQFGATDGVPGYANRHMTGGYEHMYHVTDMWEAWIDLFEQVRANADKNDIKNLWISLTCYTNPSPWFLQWANSVWLQCIHDQSDAGDGTKMDKQMNYRDAAYYDFINNHQFQFPLANIYNHDPVYGVEGTGMNINTATDEQFANYLYTQASRGTSFWELYFSASIMTPGKWQVTSEFLKWAEENNHLLRNAKMFGGSPNTNIKLGSTSNGGTANTYGYSGFDGENGLIMIRNPKSTADNVTFKFDATNGVQINSGDYTYTLEHVYNPTDTATAKDKPSDAKLASGTGTFTYGQEYTFNLQPQESITLRVTKKKDATAPKIASLASDGDKTLTVKFDEFVKLTADSGLSVDGAEVAKVTPSADRVTFAITLKEAPKNLATLTVNATSALKDLAGNGASDSKFVTYRKANKVASLAEADYAGKTKNLGTSGRSLNNANGFTVIADVTTTSANAVLAAQPKGYTVGIDANGHAYVTLNGATATSDVAVNDGAKHSIAAVKENNGMLKVYVDGNLAGSSYKAENMTYAIPAGKATVGSAAFAGKLAVSVYDKATGYDTLKGDNTAPGVENAALKKTVTMGWAKDGSAIADKSDRPGSMAVDGTIDTNNYAEFGQDNKTDGSYLQVDLGKEYTIQNNDGGESDAVKLYRYWNDSRTYKGSVVVLSEDATFDKNDTVVYNSDAADVFGFGKGTDATYAETSAGKGFSVKAGTKARYVRVYMQGTSTGGTTNHIVELQVFGKAEAEVPTVDPVDKSELEARLAVLKDVDTTGATDSSKKAFDAAVAAAQRVFDNAEATQEEVDDAVNSLEGLEGTLVARADTKAANDLLAKVKDLKEADYTPATWKQFADAKAALEKALKNADDLTQDQLDPLVDALRDKWGKLAPAGGQEPVAPNTDAARKVLTDANAKVEKDYTAKSWAPFAEARKALADALANTQGLTQEKLDSLVSNLQARQKELKKAPTTPGGNGGDNGNGGQEPVAPNTDAAKKALAEANAKVEKDYTAKSWAPFAEARKALADALANTQGLTQEKLDSLVSELQARQNALKKASTTTPGGNGDQTINKKPGLPNTGASIAAVVAAVAVLAVAGGAVLAVRRRRA